EAAASGAVIVKEPTLWIFAQSSGDLFHDEALTGLALGQPEAGPIPVGCGYSGAGASKNCPADQAKHNLGPIPRGFYEIQPPRDTIEHGPFVLALLANQENRMNGRGGFLIHGDSLQNPGTASQGCIILGRAIRQRIWESGDRDLKVVADVPKHQTGVGTE